MGAMNVRVAEVAAGADVMMSAARDWAERTQSRISGIIFFMGSMIRGARGCLKVAKKHD